MTESDLRVLVREAIAKYVDVDLASPPASNPVLTKGSLAAGHPSLAIVAVPSGAAAGGACIIEPAVLCTHCGYCRTYGH
jgi:hypothetical protein